MSLTVTSMNCLHEMSADVWNRAQVGNSGLSHALLSIVEQARINDLKHHYLAVCDERGETVGRANLYRVRMDFATIDRSLPASAHAVVKRWYPDLMAFELLECGQFTMIGEGVQARSQQEFDDVLALVIDEMERIGHEAKVDFLFVRDVSLEAYPRYLSTLLARGFVPACGFPNASLAIRWPSLEAYLDEQDSKTRYKLRSCLQLQSKLDIDVEVNSQFADFSVDMERLWRNVNAQASDYSREQLNATFFAACSASGHAEAILFRHRGKLIAFMLNIVGEDDYVMLDWGVDYEFEHYRRANLYRAASVCSLERAILLGKKRMELGITNYVPKLLLGARITPVAYFVKHVEQPWKSRTLAKLITDNVAQPDELAIDTSESGLTAGETWRNVVRSHQSDRRIDDLFRRVDDVYKFDALKLSGLYGLYPPFSSAQTQRVKLAHGEVILLGTNSYLGLGVDERVVSAAEQALRRYGSGCSGSPLLNGTLELHLQLERELADFVQKPAALICSTGYQANLTAISAVCGTGDLIVMDARNHRSLFDGARLSGAEYVVYGHRDMGALRRTLERRRGRRTLIVTDSVFSMEGTLAPLGELCEVAEEYGARLYVDESHALGVLGPGGRGLAEQLGVLHRVDLVMGTFSKSLAGVGGFVAGQDSVISHIKHHGAGHVFSASLPPAVVGSVLEALAIVRSEPERRQRVIETAEYAALGLQRLGYRAEFHGVPIVPVVLGNTTLALAAYKHFMAEGVYVNPIGPPAVPEAQAGFRTSYMATHTRADIDDALRVFERHRAELTHSANVHPAA